MLVSVRICSYFLVTLSRNNYYHGSLMNICRWYRLAAFKYKYIHVLQKPEHGGNASWTDNECMEEKWHTIRVEKGGKLKITYMCTQNADNIPIISHCSHQKGMK